MAKNALLFADGAVHAALWTTGPLLLPSLMHRGDGDSRDQARLRRRPLSAEDALAMMGTLSGTDYGNATANASTISDRRRPEQTASSDAGAFASSLLAFVAGRALGRRAFDGRHRLLLSVRRSPCGILWRNTPPHRWAYILVGSLASSLLLNWGLGIFTFGGWMAIRFAIAFISGAIAAWGKQASLVEGRDPPNDGGCKEKGNLGEYQMGMEEDKLGSIMSSSSSSSDHLWDMKWLDGHWLAGAAASAFVGGWAFYPLNRLMVAFRPHERTYTFLLVMGLCGLVDRCLWRCYSKNGRSDARIFDGRGDDKGTANKVSSSLQRRKQVHTQLQTRTLLEGEQGEEQTTSFFDDQTEKFFAEEQRATNFEDVQIQRSSSFESQQFFDCLDDIELMSEHPIDVECRIIAPTATPTAPSRENQIAAYSNRRVLYPDGAPADVPAGESASRIPLGYLSLCKNDPLKAREKYKQTRRWRREERIHSVHARPHRWFPRIKDAYSHVIHGFARDGTPVVYESPGTMNLKELFRNGCRVDDMVFHYCYLMEYLSNLESVLTELHADDAEGGDDSWQDELAAYAHAKQERLQRDPVAYGFCVVMDISGVGPSVLSSDVMAYLNRAGETNAAHYPGSMRRTTVINAPLFVGLGWGMVRKVIPESVAVDLLSAAQTKEGGLTRHIDEDQIPVECGGRSRYKLGEHPFEVGLRELVERQGEGGGVEIPSASAVVGDSPPPRDSTTPVYFSPSPPPPEMDVEFERDDAISSGETGAAAQQEWDGLGSRSVLTVAATLHFFVFVVIGSLELALPYWIISPPKHGGAGCDARRTGTAVLVSCLVIAWVMHRSRLSRLARTTVEKSPLRGFRMGVGASCFALVCVGLTPLALDPYRSTTGLLCVSAHLSLLCLGGALAILSLARLSGEVASSSGEGNDASPPDAIGWVRSSKSSPDASATGRVVGCLCTAPVFRWSVGRDLFFPFNASFSLCLMACICWLLYIVSFSLRAAGAPPPPVGQRRKRESQFASAVASCVSFVNEVWMVALADVIFLANELSRKGPSSRDSR